MSVDDAVISNFIFFTIWKSKASDEKHLHKVDGIVATVASPRIEDGEVSGCPVEAKEPIRAFVKFQFAYSLWVRSIKLFKLFSRARMQLMIVQDRSLLRLFVQGSDPLDVTRVIFLARYVVIGSNCNHEILVMYVV